MDVVAEDADLAEAEAVVGAAAHGAGLEGAVAVVHEQVIDAVAYHQTTCLAAAVQVALA